MNVAVARNIGMASSPFSFVKHGAVCPMLKEIRKEALKHLSLALRAFDQLSSWLPLRYFRVISLS